VNALANGGANAIANGQANAMSRTSDHAKISEVKSPDLTSPDLPNLNLLGVRSSFSVTICNVRGGPVDNSAATATDTTGHTPTRMMPGRIS